MFKYLLFSIIFLLQFLYVCQINFVFLLHLLCSNPVYLFISIFHFASFPHFCSLSLTMFTSVCILPCNFSIVILNLEWILSFFHFFLEFCQLWVISSYCFINHSQVLTFVPCSYHSQEQLLHCVLMKIHSRMLGHIFQLLLGNMLWHVFFNNWYILLLFCLSLYYLCINNVAVLFFITHNYPSQIFLTQAPGERRRENSHLGFTKFWLSLLLQRQTVFCNHHSSV